MRNSCTLLGVTATLGLAFAAMAQPANDLCANATVVGEGTTPWDNTNAGAEGASSCGFGGNVGTADIWFQFTPGATSTYTLSLCAAGTLNDTIMSVYDSCGGSEIACNDDFCGLLSQLSVSLTAGTPYIIRVASWSNTPTFGTGNLTISVPPPGPANDNCANATVITMGSPVTVDNTSATDDGPPSSCGFGGSPGFSDVWYSFTAPSAGCFQFSTCGGGLDTIVTVLDGCGGSELACDDDACGFAAGSTARATLTSGQTVLVRVASYDNVTQGPTSLEVFGGTVPANDLCAGAIAIVPGTSTAFDNGCTGTDGSSSCGFGGDTGGSDLWYSFTAVSSGMYRLDTCNTFDTTLAVFDGCGGSELACNDDFCGLSSQLDFTATAGTHYIIRLAGWNGTQGTGNLNFQGPLVAPANDLCSAATVVTVGSTPFTNLFAGTEGASSCGFGGDPGAADVWYQFTAPGNNSYRVDTCGSFDTQLGIYDSCGGSELACNDDFCGLSSGVTFAATAGTTYIIRLAGWNGTEGSGMMTIAEFVPQPNDTCATASVVSVGSTPFDTSAATNDAGTSCGGGGGSPDLFYSFTPATSGAYQIDLCGSSFDTVLAVLDSCGGSEIACNDDFCGLQSSLTVSMTGGNTYIVQVDGFLNANSGAGTLNITSLGGGGGGDYTVCESAGVFEDISATGTPASTISDCDDCFESLPIGFTFDFFGTPFTDVQASSNGLCAFGVGSAVYFNVAIPNNGDPNNFCAAIWDDFYPIGAGDIYYRTSGAAGSRTFTLSWQHVTQFALTTDDSFQIVLYEGSNNIEFRYGSITPETPAGDYSIGCENATGLNGTSISATDIGSGNTARFLIPVGGSCPSSCDSIDFNGDSIFPDTQDITDFISVFGGGPCPTGTCGDVDFNNDGLIPDITDIQALISVFGGGPCIH